MKTKLPHENVYTRIGQSKVDVDGIGVLSIKFIPKGTYVFQGDRSEMNWFTEIELNFESLPKPIKDLYEDFCVKIYKDNITKYGCPDSFNNMPISWYLNCSKDPNMACDENYNFYAIKDISVGDELTADYDTYSD